VSAREPNPALRESFLSRWGDSEHGRTLRRYGELLFTMATEAESILLRGEPSSDEPFAVEDIRTALVDLGPVLETLDIVPANAKREGVPGLGRSAAGWTRQLRKIAAAMEAALAKWEAEP
jgi:hypothetical protein